MNIQCQANSIVMNALCSPWRTFYGNSPAAYGLLPPACWFNLTWKWKHVDIRHGVRLRWLPLLNRPFVSHLFYMLKTQMCHLNARWLQSKDQRWDYLFRLAGCLWFPSGSECVVECKLHWPHHGESSLQWKPITLWDEAWHHYGTG